MEKLKETGIQIDKFDRVYILLVKKLLNKLKKGKLKVILPNGEIEVYGEEEKPFASIEIHSNNFFKRIVLHGDIGFGEAFMAGEWTSPSVKEVISWMIANIENIGVASGAKEKSPLLNLFKLSSTIGHKLKHNSKQNSEDNIHYHYDLGNDFYSRMLDPTMTYSCAVFDSSDDLHDAQNRKYHLLAQDLKLNSEDHLLEIGSGWGGMAIYCAKNFNCKVTSITISEKQFEFAKQRVEKENLSHLVEIRYLDYRELEGQFTKIVSIEMLEAVGDEYYEQYFKTIDRCLAPGGLVAIQVITSPCSRYDSFKNGVDWIQKHIFPGSLLPSVSRILEVTSDKTALQLHNLRDIGLDYARTLNCWREKYFENIDYIKQLGFNDEFIRKWDYYLQYCEAAFETRNISDVQILLTRPNNTTL